VYAPSNANDKSMLPVYFFIQGGGFNFNSNANYDGSGLVAASGHEIVVVTFNYRVGPYGFLASQEIEDSPSASLNNGLKDQRKALEWVQKYISRFGGDPKHVVLGGDSAGAASIAYHLTAYGGRNDGLFVVSTLQSPPSWMFPFSVFPSTSSR
jgi:carboxylesterase type B